MRHVRCGIHDFSTAGERTDVLLLFRRLPLETRYCKLNETALDFPGDGCGNPGPLS